MGKELHILVRRGSRRIRIETERRHVTKVVRAPGWYIRSCVPRQLAMPTTTVMCNADLCQKKAPMSHAVEARLNHPFSGQVRHHIGDHELIHEDVRSRSGGSEEHEEVGRATASRMLVLVARWPKCIALRFLDAANFEQGALFFVGTEMAGQSFPFVWFIEVGPAN